MAETPFVLFTDDDVTWGGGVVHEMLIKAITFKLDVVYGDYIGVVHPSASHGHPMGPVWHHRSEDWSIERLLKGPYISTMALVRRSAAPEWDDTLDRLQDWDYWIRMAMNGCNGWHLPVVSFIQYFLPGPSITSRGGYHRARNAVLAKAWKKAQREGQEKVMELLDGKKEIHQSC